MNIYTATYSSPNNLFSGAIQIEADDHKKAMLKFFEWIQTKEVWGHLWSLNVSIQKTEKIETI